MSGFRVVCFSDLYGGDWIVVRTSDWRIMTSGNVGTCLRWVDVWGPVTGDKRGVELSARARARMTP